MKSNFTQCDCDANTRNLLSREPELCMYVFIQQLCQSIVEEVVKCISQLIIMHVVTNNYNINVFPYTSSTSRVNIYIHPTHAIRQARARPSLVASYPPKQSTTNIVSISSAASYRTITDELAGCRMGDFCGWRISRRKNGRDRAQGTRSSSSSALNNGQNGYWPGLFWLERLFSIEDVARCD
jgi:hypothetical protein